MTPILTVLALVTPATVLHASGGWVAIDRGGVCEALSRSVSRRAGVEDVAVAGIAFDSRRRAWGRVVVRLTSPPRPGSSVVLEAGGRSFLLESSERRAWGRDAAQDSAIIESLREGSGMRIVTRAPSGRRVVERFDTQGASTAIDSAAARCAGKIR